MRRMLAGVLVTCLVLGGVSAVYAEGQADARAIIDKAIQATGGKEKLTKLKGITMKAKGKVVIMGMDLNFTVEASVQMPNKTRTQFEGDFQGNKFTRLQIINGSKGWVSMAGMVTDMPENELINGQEEMYADWVSTLVPLSEAAYTLAPLGESKVGDRAVVGVKVTHKDHKDVSLYFDKETGLLSKLSRRAKDPMQQEVDQDSIYSDYKDYDGVKRSRKTTVKHDGKDFLEFEVSEYKATEKLEDNLFEMPGQ
jgi:hypothetical protein